MPDEGFLRLLHPFLKYLKSNDQIDLHQPLRDLGMDSLSAIELVVAIEDHYGIEFPDECFNENTLSSALSLWNAVAAIRQEA